MKLPPRAWAPGVGWAVVGLLTGVLAAPAARAADPPPFSPSLLEIPRGHRLPGLETLAPTRMSMHGPENSEEPADLTNLSLEQLLDLRITTINVLGGHTHLKGQKMVSYHFMLMDMGGYLDGTRSLSNREVLQRFPTIHTGMTMQMHMLEFMYAPSDDVTLMAMLPYKVMSMDHLTRAGTRFGTHAEGFGDVQLMGLITVLGDQRKRGHRLLVNAGLSLPSGSIDERDFVRGRGLLKLEYPMQLGSGTVDLLPGVTYLGDSSRWAWGAQALGTIRLGRNRNDYRFGNQLYLTAWGVYRLKDWVAPTLRVQTLISGRVHGRDPELDPLSNPEANPRLQGGRRTDLLFGLHFYAPRGPLKDTRLTLEGGFPVYQSLNGPQLKTNWMVSLGISRVF